MANTLVVVGFGVFIFTAFPANVVLVSILAAIGCCVASLFIVFCAVPTVRAQWVTAKHAYVKHKDLEKRMEECVRAERVAQAPVGVVSGSEEARIDVRCGAN